MKKADNFNLQINNLFHLLIISNCHLLRVNKDQTMDNLHKKIINHIKI